MRKLLIGLTGRTGNGGVAGCGKDTVAAILQKKMGCKIIGFSDPIYAMVKAGFGIDGQSDEWQDRSKKNAPIPWIDPKVSLRYILETLGTEWGRNFIARDIWIRLAQREYEQSSHGIIIRDLRFQNEVDWLEEQRGIVVHVFRRNYFSDDASKNHLSNIPLDLKSNHYVVKNESTLDNLEIEVDKMLNLVL